MSKTKIKHGEESDTILREWGRWTIEIERVKKESETRVKEWIRKIRLRLRK